MAKFVFDSVTWTPTAQVDQVLTGVFQAIVPGSSTQYVLVSEIYEGGQAGASAVNAMTWAHSSTLGITPTALAVPNSAGPLNGLTISPATLPTCYVAAATAPNRSGATTVARLNLTFNAFGGIVRWVAYPGEEWGMYGTAVNVSESVLSAQNVGTAGLMGSHIVYEPI
jgi:hypothetical protein